MTDTVTAIVFNSIVYGPATYTYVTQVDQISQQLENDNPTESETFTIPTAATWTTWDTVTWPDLSATLVDVISSPSVPLPGIGAQPDSIAFTQTGAIIAGQAAPQSVKKTFSGSVTVIVPPQSTYEFQFGGYEQDATVPFTVEGYEYYASGASARFVGNGVVLSDDTGVFTSTITCLVQPGGCPPPASPLPIPEPSTLVTVPMAFAAMLLLAAVRRRRARVSSGGGLGMLTPA
jgi:hypothetical protein